MSGSEIPPQWAAELFYETVELIDSLTLANLGDIGGVLTLLLFCYKAVKRSASTAKSAGAKAGVYLADFKSKDQLNVWVSSKTRPIGKVTVTNFNSSLTGSIGNATASGNTTASFGF